MISHRCKNCAWWDNAHKSLADVNDKAFGYCRKHKPLTVQRGNYVYGIWPLVDQLDLCGEFRQDPEQEVS